MQTSVPAEMFFVIAINRLDAASGASREIGQFEAREAALEAARHVIDDWLTRRYKPGTTPERLFQQFLAFGDIPSVFGDAGQTMCAPFNYTEYARERSRKICSTPTVSAQGLT